MKVVSKIVSWHIDRNLIEGATDIGQYKKLMSEFGEYSDNDAQGACKKDDIGDMGVVVINIASRNGIVNELLSNPLTVHHAGYFELLRALGDVGESIFDEMECFYLQSLTEALVELWETLSSIAQENGYTLEECLEHAYNDIKDRKGRMINGTFVKESDL